MKLSKIIQTEKFRSATLYVNSNGSVKARIFLEGSTSAKIKHYLSLDVDLEVKKIKRITDFKTKKAVYYDCKENDTYVNIYYMGYYEFETSNDARSQIGYLLGEAGNRLVGVNRNGFYVLSEHTEITAPILEHIKFIQDNYNNL